MLLTRDQSDSPAEREWDFSGLFDLIAWDEFPPWFFRSSSNNFLTSGLALAGPLWSPGMVKSSDCVLPLRLAFSLTLTSGLGEPVSTTWKRTVLVSPETKVCWQLSPVIW